MKVLFVLFFLLLHTTLVFAATTDKAPLPNVWDKKWPTKYDKYFRKHSKRYFGVNFDWHWFKAQSITESTLNPKARSHTGAYGLMQIQPRTFKEIQQRNPHFRDIRSPRWNIAAGIYYNRKLYNRWRKKGVSKDERLNFSFGSYHAGFVGILRAINKSPHKDSDKNAKLIAQWDDVKDFAPKETEEYVQRIKDLMLKTAH